MKLINKKYVELDSSDIFVQIVNAGGCDEIQDENKIKYFKNLLSIVMKHKKVTKRPINKFYLKVSEIDINDADISRDTIINALVYASITKDFQMVKEITPYLYAKSYKYSENNEILEYILEHAIPYNELIDGEEEQLIFNSETNSFEYGYIYDHGVKLERRKK